MGATDRQLLSRAGVLIAVFLLALGACEKAAKQQDDIQPGLSIQIPRPQPKVGDQTLKTQTLTMDMTIDVKGSKIKVKFTKGGDELEKVLAVDGFAKSKIQVTYQKLIEKQEMGNKSEEKPDPRHGKTYVVWRENGSLQATYEDGGTPPPDELKEVLDDNDEVGVADEMDAIIAARTWKSGEKYTFTADEIARINASKAKDDDDKEELTLCELTLRNAKDGVATFTIAMGMKVQGDQQKGAFEFTIRGDARADQTNGHLLGISGTGDLKGTVQGMGITGTVTMKGEDRLTKAP
jgi:hypothetical protein